MKKMRYKLFLILLVGLSLGSGPIAQNEIAKMLESLTGTGNAQVQELDEEEKEKESEEIRKKRTFPNSFKIFYDR